MTITLNEILMLVGRLDDSSGFDTPRERFRRFLLERVTDAQAARMLIEQCQHAPGDQHHRALQDLVVLLGRCLGFETRFGSHLTITGVPKVDGLWRSRPQLDVVLEIRTDQTQTTDCDALSRALAALTQSSRFGAETRSVGLCVVTPLYTGRRFEEALAAAQLDSSIRIVSLRSLLSIADMVDARRFTHDDVVQLMGSGFALDFVVELVQRSASVREAEDRSTPQSPPPQARAEGGFWLATIGADRSATPEEFVELVIGKRHIFGVTADGAPDGAVQPGDGICFYIPGKGVVGHSHARSIAQDGAGIRDAHRFCQVVHLQDTALHLGAPVSLEEERQLRLRAARASRDRTAHSLTRISQDEFAALTTSRDQDRTSTGASSSAAPGANGSESREVPLSVGDLRSRA